MDAKPQISAVRPKKNLTARSLSKTDQGRVSRSMRRSSLTPLLFLAPYLVVLLFFGIGPAAAGALLSVLNWSTGGIEFAGLANFAAVFADARFLPALGHVAAFLAIWLPIMFLGVTGLALLVHARTSWFSSLSRLLFYVPGALTGAAGVLLWAFLLEPSLSPFSPLLNALGFESRSDVFTSGNLPWIFALMVFTTGVGHWVVIFYGAMQNIPLEVVEAAKVDGCNAVSLALRIKLPLIRKYILYMLILVFTAGIQIFVQPVLLSQAIQGSVSSTWSLNQLSYSYAFTIGQFGSAAALSTVLLAICVLGSVVVIRRTDLFDVR